MVGKSAPAPAEHHIPAEESLCPVVSHNWVNSEYKHLIVDASPKALAVKPGQFFNLLCPSPDAGELWFRRPQSVYRVDRENRRIEFFYKCVGRGTFGLATLEPCTHRLRRSKTAGFHLRDEPIRKQPGHALRRDAGRSGRAAGGRLVRSLSRRW